MDYKPNVNFPSDVNTDLIGFQTKLSKVEVICLLNVFKVINFLTSCQMERLVLLTSKPSQVQVKKTQKTNLSIGNF